MSAKASTNEIMQHLIMPLGALFGDLPENKRGIYLAAIDGYRFEDLHRVFMHLRDTWEPKSRDTFPPISVIHRSRNARTASGGAAAQPGERFEPFKEQHETQKLLIDEYMNQFDQGKLCDQARSAGYYPSLFAYVREVATIQAQLLVPTNGIGYNSATLFAHISKNEGQKQLNRVMNDFWEEMRKQVSSEGRIGVTVPIEAITHWREFNDALRRNSNGASYHPSQPSQDDLKNGISSNINNSHIQDAMAGVLMNTQPSVNHKEMNVGDYF